MEINGTLIRRFIFVILVITILPCICSSQTAGYFQQEVNYRILVTLDDKKHELSGYESIQYINNSPDSLYFIYFHIWPNAYSSNETSLAKQLYSFRGKEKLFRDPQLRGYIDSLTFVINDQAARWNIVDNQPDICVVYPPAPVPAGDTIIISTPFHVKIPEGSTSRLGHIGQSYQISQWFPKPAVYDRSGWQPMPYLDQGEFYSEFGTFDVKITLPSNYIVGASGEITDKDVPGPESSDSSGIIKYFRYGNLQFPPSSATMKTLHYSGSNIHDFAWFADKRFHVRRSKVILPVSGREITTEVLFTDTQADLWENAIGYVNDAIMQFSEWIGDYPYDNFVAVQTALGAGAGMEYPGIAVIGLADNAYSLEEVIAHEILHNWFYAALGTDERRFPFMDESITSAYEMRYMQKKYPDARFWEVYIGNQKMAKMFGIRHLPARTMAELEWLLQARNNLEQPPDLPADTYSEMNYSTSIYDRAAFGFNNLRGYLGDSLFDSIMKDYYSEWKFRHPYPSDLRDIFESHTSSPLEWFFDDLLGTSKRTDYAVKRARGDSILIKNKGEMKAPFPVTGFRGNNPSFEWWEEGFTGSKWIKVPGNDYSVLKINYRHITPELYYTNNTYKRTGIFRKVAVLKPQLLFPVEDPDRSTLKFFPLVNWNSADGFMAGAGINNGILLPKHIEFFIMPFYTFKDPGVSGNGRVSFNIFPYSSFIRKASVSFEGSSFGATVFQKYHVVRSGIELSFRNNDFINGINRKLTANYFTASDISIIETDVKAHDVSFLQLRYSSDRNSAVNPFGVGYMIETNGSYCKTSVEFNHRLSYYGKDRGLDTRLFAGLMISEDASHPIYSLSESARSGRELYLYQGDFAGRFSDFPETFWSRQMLISEGGMITHPDSIGFNRWLFSSSFTSNLPGIAGKLPVRPFINLAFSERNSFMWEAGFSAGIRHLLEFYIPLVAPQSSSPVRDRIRFILNLDFLYRIKPSGNNGI